MFIVFSFQILEYIFFIFEDFQILKKKHIYIYNIESNKSIISQKIRGQLFSSTGNSDIKLGRKFSSTRCMNATGSIADAIVSESPL